jgi:hypothetical protein
MKRNMGTVDRILRLVISAAFATFYFTGTVTGVFGIVLLALGGIFTLTSLVGFCPIYAIFGLKTCAVKKTVS